MNGRYRFRQRWEVSAPPHVVFDALCDTADWPNWWPALMSVTTVARDTSDDPTAQLQRFVVRAPLGYRLIIDARFVDVAPPRRILARLAGNLSGEATADLRRAGRGRTVVTTALDVQVTRRWMRIPGMRLVLKANHDRVMAGARKGLAAKTGTCNPDPG